MQGSSHERACRPAGGESAQVGEVAHAAAGQQLEVRKARAQLAYQFDLRARAGPDPREIEHDHLTYAGARQARQRLGGIEPSELGVWREEAAGAEIEAEDERKVRHPLECRLVRERLGADHHACHAQLQQRPGRGEVGDTGVHHDPSFLCQGGERCAVRRSTRDRVEIRDVELVELELSAEGAGDAEGVGAGDEPASERAIAFALSTHGVHGGSALEIDDWDHSHYWSPP